MFGNGLLRLHINHTHRQLASNLVAGDLAAAADHRQQLARIGAVVLDEAHLGAAVRYIGTVKSPRDVDYGHYTVVDADAYRYLDGAHQHRLSLLLENLLDRDYATSMDSGARKVQNLGRPFTTELRYTYSF